MMVILLNCITLGMYQPCVDDQCKTNRCKILQVRTYLSHESAAAEEEADYSRRIEESEVGVSRVYLNGSHFHKNDSQSTVHLHVCVRERNVGGFTIQLS